MQINNFPNNLGPLQTGDPAGKTKKENQQDIETPLRQDQAVLPVQELFRKGELRQVERLEALSRSENLSLKAKEALQQYQATEEAGRDFEGGELLGIDIIV